MGDEGNYKNSYNAYLFDLFEYEIDELMKIIDELEYPTKDRTKNYILQLMDKGREEGIEIGREMGKAKWKEIGKEIEKEDTIKKMLLKGCTIEFICEIMETSPEVVHRISNSKK